VITAELLLEGGPVGGRDVGVVNAGVLEHEAGHLGAAGKVKVGEGGLRHGHLLFLFVSSLLFQTQNRELATGIPNLFWVLSAKRLKTTLQGNSKPKGM
jgi:hypothetical protein